MIYKLIKKIKDIKKGLWTYSTISIYILFFSLLGILIAIVNCILIAYKIYYFNRQNKFKASTYWDSKNDLMNKMLEEVCLLPLGSNVCSTFKKLVNTMYTGLYSNALAGYHLQFDDFILLIACFLIPLILSFVSIL